VDGGLKTGRHVVVGALLGAEEFSFGTAAVIASGCIMARACHLNTCPVGIATQKQELRKKFPQVAEWVMEYYLFVAQETREWLASIGARTLDEIVGRVDLLQYRPRPSARFQEMLHPALAQPSPLAYAAPAGLVN
jgi:glutamate synthase (ferredoxin)